MGAGTPEWHGIWLQKPARSICTNETLGSLPISRADSCLHRRSNMYSDQQRPAMLHHSFYPTSPSRPLILTTDTSSSSIRHKIRHCHGLSSTSSKSPLPSCHPTPPELNPPFPTPPLRSNLRCVLQQALRRPSRNSPNPHLCLPC